MINTLKTCSTSRDNNLDNMTFRRINAQFFILFHHHDYENPALTNYTKINHGQYFPRDSSAFCKRSLRKSLKLLI